MKSLHTDTETPGSIHHKLRLDTSPILDACLSCTGTAEESLTEGLDSLCLLRKGLLELWHRDAGQSLLLGTLKAAAKGFVSAFLRQPTHFLGLQFVGSGRLSQAGVAEPELRQGIGDLFGGLGYRV